MLKRSVLLVSFILILVSIVLSACSSTPEHEGQLYKAGLILEGKAGEEPWNAKGYRGLTAIKEKFGVEVYFKENVETDQEVTEIVREFSQKGVNLIFGHGSKFGRSFVDMSTVYPDIHFVYFNGGQHAENVTSYNFNAHAMGFFAGMIAGEMSQTEHVGILAAYEWQSEIEGYYEGVKHQNPAAEVHIDYVNDWNNAGSALDAYERQRDVNVDVFYPIGNQFSRKVIEQAAEDNLYTIGYINDQSNIGERYVLTSTIQDVEKIYEMAAEHFDEDRLAGGVYRLGFPENVLSLGPYSQDIPRYFRNEIEHAVDMYKTTGLLPNELSVH
ncbi:Transcriptional activator protein med [Lentibacillus sp. JNUCC-1]|uniref:BMP family ABC transporter substrate-binding protein n=1 Tax=Lentibacillus sp. JNUCC-1 TaxID=2654513 RepID=UPI0012E740F2|nr:BMP family ABC transporter substrate-binding protein [Lentibacillus sp. JNUCC-1]MUV36524.1 Transcriptional activator protein med [Lentibacillus sp. JNUCC-1]